VGGWLGEAKRRRQLEEELRRLGYIPLIVVNEVDHIPFDPEAVNPSAQPRVGNATSGLFDRHLEQALQRLVKDLRAKVDSLVRDAEIRPQGPTLSAQGHI
jgi:hypothetical protein